MCSSDAHRLVLLSLPMVASGSARETAGAWLAGDSDGVRRRSSSPARVQPAHTGWPASSMIVTTAESCPGATQHALLRL